MASLYVNRYGLLLLVIILVRFHPQRWLMEKCLKVTHDKIRNENRKISDVYLEVGLKNMSHFSNAYKKQLLPLRAVKVESISKMFEQ